MWNSKLSIDQSEKPLYVQLSESIAQNLIRGQGEGARLPSIRELSKRYRVSMITAIKAVEKLKSEEIIFGRPGKGLYVKNMERLLEYYSAGTKTIGATFLDIYNISSSFVSTVICALSSECSNLGLNLQIFSTPAAVGMKDNPLFWRNIRKKNLDGLILASRMPVEDIRLLQEHGIPFVWVNVDLPGENIFCAISNKLYALNMCLLHVKKLGHKKVALLSAQEDVETESYLETLCPGYGLKHSYHILEGPEREVGYHLAKQAIESEKPDIILGRGTELTASACSYITEQRMSLPDDLGLIAFSGSASNPFLPANITVLNSRAAAMAAQAVSILYRILEGDGPVERRTVVPGELIIRGSCGFPMQEDGEITVSKIEALEALSYKER